VVHWRWLSVPDLVWRKQMVLAHLTEMQSGLPAISVYPQFGMNASSTSTTLKSYGSCQDVEGSNGTPPYNEFEGYSYHIDCNNNTVMDYDNTSQICGVSYLKYPG
jgi:hypothetical protein